MPLPKGLARLNRRVTNHLMRPFAARVSGFAVLEHTGRRSGAVYETPLNVFVEGDSLMVALTYGSDVDWLKNVRAAGESTFVVQGERIHVGRPVAIPRAEGYERVSRPVGMALAAVDVSEFVVFPILHTDQRNSTFPDVAD
jgi:deazaflavin-dependent oxidoreductase (nitroreductase family)